MHDKRNMVMLWSVSHFNAYNFMFYNLFVACAYKCHIHVPYTHSTNIETEHTGEVSITNYCNYCYSIFNSKTGLLGFGTSAITSFSSALQSNNVRHKTLTGREVNEIYSNQLQLPDEYLCILSENGGMIKAAHAVATLQVSIYIEYTTRTIHCKNK